ncbi:hypothetical protein JHN60_29370 [Streptomyces sp. MBT51]|nr:hypothetical protein [Streptomyces sp. MBT51]
MAREDDRAGDGHGYERDETDTQLRHLVRHLVADGDARAQAAGRRTRRTHADMAPGVERQPVLHLAPAVTFRPSAAQLAVTV